MTHDEAMRTYAALIRRWGTQWTARMGIPQSDWDLSDWDLMEQCQKVLSYEDKRAAIGLPPSRRPNSLVQEQYEQAWRIKHNLR